MTHKDSVFLTDDEKALLSNKTCLVTGANSGIGYHTSRGLAARGADLLWVCRDANRAHTAAQSISEEFGVRPKVFLADLSDGNDIRRVGDEIRSEHQALDVLVNNAGGYFPSRWLSRDGLEMTFALNHMGYFRLTQALLPIITPTPGSRIVNVASRAHQRGSLDFDDLQFEHRPYRALHVYSTSKLLNILFTNALARRLEGTDTTVNCLHPGVVRTGFGQDFPSAFSLLFRLASSFFLSPLDGARTSIHLASAPALAQVTGQYFVRCHPTPPHRRARSLDDADTLWRLSESLA